MRTDVDMIIVSLFLSIKISTHLRMASIGWKTVVITIWILSLWFIWEGPVSARCDNPHPYSTHEI